MAAMAARLRRDKGWLHAASWFCLGLVLIAAVVGIVAQL